MKRKTTTKNHPNELPSKVVSKEELAIFDPPCQQKSIEKAERLEFGPTGAISNQGTIIFNIPKSETYFTDLSTVFLDIDLRVTHANGNNLTVADVHKIQPTNAFFHALFSRCTVSLNDVKIGSEMAHHPQIDLLKMMLSHSNDYLTDNLGSAIAWYKDYSYPSAQAPVRHRFIANSKTVKLMGRLSDSFLTTTNLLVPQTEVQIALERNPSEFCLIRTDKIKQVKKTRNSAGQEIETEEEHEVTDTYKVEILSCMLSVRRVKLNQETFNELQARMARGALARYQFVDTTARTTMIPQGLKVWKARSILSGKLPSRVLFGICETDSVTGGSWQNNPMAFPSALYNVNYVNFLVDERPLLSRAFTPDFKSKNYARSYMNLLDTARALKTGAPVAISSDDFANNYGLFGLDLTSDGSDLTHTEFGNFSIEVRFSKSTPRPLCGFLVVEFPSMLTLGADGVVKTHNL